MVRLSTCYLRHHGRVTFARRCAATAPQVILQLCSTLIALLCTQVDAWNVIPNGVDTQSSDFKENDQKLRSLSAQLNDLVRLVSLGGDETARKRHTTKVTEV